MIRIVLSTAIIDDNINIEKRLKEYKECFEIVKSLGYDFTIVETVKEKSEILEEYSDDVIYTGVNGTYKNRGTNYVNAFKKFLSDAPYHDDDLIIHITGRYPLVDDSFFVKCMNLSHDKVGLFRKDDHGQFFLFLYAMRFKSLKTLLGSINLPYMEANMINLERIFSTATNHDYVEFTDRLGIIGRQSGSTTNYGTMVY